MNAELKRASISINESDLTEDGIALAFADTLLGKWRFDHGIASWVMPRTDGMSRDVYGTIRGEARNFVRAIRRGLAPNDPARAQLGTIAFSEAVERAARYDQRLAFNSQCAGTIRLPAGR